VSLLLGKAGTKILQELPVRLPVGPGLGYISQEREDCWLSAVETIFTDEITPLIAGANAGKYLFPLIKI
jgi:hypothetical protein